MLSQVYMYSLCFGGVVFFLRSFFSFIEAFSSSVHNRQRPNWDDTLEIRSADINSDVNKKTLIYIFFELLYPPFELEIVSNLFFKGSSRLDLHNIFFWSSIYWFDETFFNWKNLMMINKLRSMYKAQFLTCTYMILIDWIFIQLLNLGSSLILLQLLFKSSTWCSEG